MCRGLDSHTEPLKWEKGLECYCRKLFQTHLDHIIYIRHVVYGRRPLIYFCQGHQVGRMIILNIQPIVDISLVKCSSTDGLTTVSTQLPFVLTRAPNTCISASFRGKCWDAIWPNSIFMASFNSFFIFFHYSLRFLIISANCCRLIDAVELLEPRDACPKYWLIVTPTPTTRKWPRCSGRPIAVFSKSWRPWGTKLKCVICSYKESCNKQGMYIDQMMLSLYKLHVKLKMNSIL